MTEIMSTTWKEGRNPQMTISQNQPQAPAAFLSFFLMNFIKKVLTSAEVARNFRLLPEPP
jgi:hypothetical protein